jgi:hypothetical protein
MQQLRLELGLERKTEPPIPLDPEVREELVARLAVAIVAVHKGGNRNDGHSASP